MKELCEKIIFPYFVYLVFATLIAQCTTFNPFMDTDLHSIEWAGPANIDNVSLTCRRPWSVGAIALNNGAFLFET